MKSKYNYDTSLKTKEAYANNFKIISLEEALSESRYLENNIDNFILSSSFSMRLNKIDNRITDNVDDWLVDMLIHSYKCFHIPRKVVENTYVDSNKKYSKKLDDRIFTKKVRIIYERDRIENYLDQIFSKDSIMLVHSILKETHNGIDFMILYCRVFYNYSLDVKNTIHSIFPKKSIGRKRSEKIYKMLSR